MSDHRNGNKYAAGLNDVDRVLVMSDPRAREAYRTAWVRTAFEAGTDQTLEECGECSQLFHPINGTLRRHFRLPAGVTPRPNLDPSELELCPGSGRAAS